MSNSNKSPAFLTAFFERSKSAKRRFDSILGIRKNILAFVFVLGVISAAGVLAACKSESDDVIGGTDGATSINSSDNYIEKLYESKIEYVGDNSGVGNVLNTVFANGEKIKSFELSTADGALKGVTVKLGDNLRDVLFRDSKAAMVLLLVQNCDFVTLSGEDASAEYTRTEAEQRYGVDFAETAKSFEDFSKLYRDMFLLSSKVPIEERLGSLIIEQNSGDYLDGECQGEGHIILGKEGSVPAGSGTETADETFIFALITYGEYGFQNGIFTKVSGSGVIPTRITIDKDGNMTEYLMAKDGSEYVPSIKKMFPETLWERALSGDKADYEICVNQEREYAENYLKSIGRTAKIQEYGDFEHILPDMDTEASNKLDKVYSEYPYWIGTQEKIENGVRYVYEKDWDTGTKIVTFKKYEYDSKIVVDETAIDTKDGNLTYIKGTPRSTEK